MSQAPECRVSSVETSSVLLPTTYPHQSLPTTSSSSMTIPSSKLEDMKVPLQVECKLPTITPVVVRHQVRREGRDLDLDEVHNKEAEKLKLVSPYAMTNNPSYDGDGLTDSEDDESDNENEGDWEEKREKEQQEEQQEQREEEQEVGLEKKQEEKRVLPSSSVALQTLSTRTEILSYQDKENHLNSPSPTQASRANNFLDNIIAGQTTLSNQKRRNKDSNRQNNDNDNTTTASTVANSTVSFPAYAAVTSTASTTTTALNTNTTSTFSTHLPSPPVPSGSSSTPNSATSTLKPPLRPSNNKKRYSPGSLSEALEEVMNKEDNVLLQHHQASNSNLEDNPVSDNEEQNFFADPDDPPWLPSTAKPLKKMPKGHFKPKQVATPGSKNVSALHVSPPASDGSKKNKPKKTAPPVNPISYKVTDSKGNEINRDDPLYREHFVKGGRHTKETRKQMDSEWKRFLEFIVNYPEYGQQVVDDLTAETLADDKIADIFCNFLENRINLTKWNLDGEIVPLDLTTLDRIWSFISTMLFRELNVQVDGNPKFDKARGTKTRIAKNSKEVYNLGNHDHQAVELGRAVTNALLLSDTLNQYQPFPLVALIYIQIVLIFLPRVRTEAYNLKRGDFIFKYDSKGNPLCILYCPMGPLKKTQGLNPSTAKASFLLKRAASLPCPSMPKFCLFNLFNILFSHLDMIPFEGDRKNQRLWYECRKGRIDANQCFFRDSPLGTSLFDAITSVLGLTCKV